MQELELIVQSYIPGLRLVALFVDETFGVQE